MYYVKSRFTRILKVYRLARVPLMMVFTHSHYDVVLCLVFYFNYYDVRGTFNIKHSKNIFINIHFYFWVNILLIIINQVQLIFDKNIIFFFCKEYIKNDFHSH